MEHILKLNEIIVGRAKLAPAPHDLREARGPFRPGVGYELVEPVFSLYVQARQRRAAGQDDSDLLERFRRAKTALPLRLVDRGGRERPMTDVVIIPIEAPSGGALEMRVRITGAF
jgi:hypothetical protein